MEAGNFWRLKNFIARDESPFPLTGQDKITLCPFFLTHCKSNLLAGTAWAGQGNTARQCACTMGSDRLSLTPCPRSAQLETWHK